MFSKSLAAIEDFNEWLESVPCRHKLTVPGNHEFFLEADPSRRSLLSNATVLINEGIDIEGLSIWASPITMLCDGAFGLSKAVDRRRLYARIPNDTHIVITHGPPYGILDCTPGSDYHAGCPELLEAIQRVKPKLHVFGHIHGGHGITEKGGTLFVNAALLGPDGGIEHEPIVIRMATE
jgi:predicted phosphohydrolase